MRSEIFISVGRRLAVVLFACALSTVATSSLAEPPSPDDTYLNGLQGRWIMRGTFHEKPVTYEAVGQRVLGGAWLRLHMVDARKPPQYRADVFFGYDAKARDFIVHWLDQFGAAGARVVATGHRDGEQLVFTFPYAEGMFRDTLQRDKPRGIWMLLLESQGKNGTWSIFANFELTRGALPPQSLWRPICSGSCLDGRSARSER